MARPAIDTSSDEIVLHHVGDRTPPLNVPARDLTGNDLARLALADALTKQAATQLGVPVEQGQEPPEPTRPRVTPSMLGDVYETLIESGAFRAAKSGTQESDDDETPVARPAHGRG